MNPGPVAFCSRAVLLEAYRQQRQRAPDLM